MQINLTICLNRIRVEKLTLLMECLYEVRDDMFTRVVGDGNQFQTLTTRSA